MALCRLTPTVFVVAATGPAAVLFLLPAPRANRHIALAIGVAALAWAWMKRSVPSHQLVGLAILTGLATFNLRIAPLDGDPTAAAQRLGTLLHATAVASMLSGFVALARETDLRTATVGAVTTVLTIGLCAMTLERLPGQRSSGGDISPIKGPVPHRVFGKAYLPNSVAHSYYRDNPRAYFDEDDPVRGVWRLHLHVAGNRARLEYPTDWPTRLRVAISRVRGTTEWSIQIRRDFIAVDTASRYALTLRARADARRSIAFGITQAHPPWQGLGYYRRVSVDTAWAAYTEVFQVSANDDTAGLQFDLGGDAASVELADIDLRRVSDGQRVVPPPATRFKVAYRFNAWGCRGRNIPSARRPGTKRVLVLGDSYAIGIGVREQDAIAARLDRLLNESQSSTEEVRRYEVMACGVPGYGTLEQRLLYEHLAPRFQPEVVVLAMHWNDGHLAVDEAPGRVEPAPASRPVPDLRRNLDLASSAARGRDLARRPDRTGVELRRLLAATRTHGAKLAVVLFRLDADPRWSVLRDTAMHVLNGTNVPMIDLGDGLLAAHRPADLVVHDPEDSHPNETAHRLAADAVATFLLTTRLLAAPRPERAPAAAPSTRVVPARGQ
jgi:hypothetical protein